MSNTAIAETTDAIVELATVMRQINRDKQEKDVESAIQTIEKFAETASREEIERIQNRIQATTKESETAYAYAVKETAFHAAESGLKDTEVMIDLGCTENMAGRKWSDISLSSSV